MMTVDEIRKLVNGTTAMGREQLAQALEAWPYFIVPSILYLQNAQPGDSGRKQVLERLALTYPDHGALYELVGEDAGRFANFYPPQEQEATPDTDATIDSFLDRYGGNDEKETELLERLIFNPVPPDYSQVLEREQGPASSEADDLQKAAQAIGGILQQDRPKSEPEPPAEPEPVNEPEESDDTMLSESLAKIFVKQGKYPKALEIIKSISLKFPEKSIYFADQIRFLQKLILNEEIKNR